MNGATYSDMVTSSSQKMYMKLFVVALPKEANESKATVTGACSFAKTLQQCKHSLISVGKRKCEIAHMRKTNKK